MQILAPTVSFERIQAKVRELLPDADVITVSTAGQYERNGAPVAADDVNPEIVWVPFEAPRNGLLPTLFDRLLKSPNAKWMQVFNAGLDGQVIYKQAMAKGIRISRSNAQAPPIAEYVIAHALSLIFPIDSQREQQARKQWKQVYYREIGETRWTIIGFGSIGHEIAKRVKPLGVHLTVVRRSGDNRGLADEVVPPSDLHRVLPDADIVVLACPVNDSTRGMANDAFFEKLKEGSILVNIARGALIDSEALKRGLGRNKPAKAVLDVFDKEPLPVESWMWDHPQIRVTSHTSNAGSGNGQRTDELFLNNLQRYLAGEPLILEARREEVGL